MKQVIVSGISCVVCGSMMAQSPATANTFSTQLKQLVNHAKGGFKTVPLRLQLKESLTSSIVYNPDSTYYYHFVFADMMPVRKADSLRKQLIKKIKAVLANNYTQRDKSKANGILETSFVNKNKSSFEEVVVTTHCVIPYCNVSLDIFYKKNTQSSNTDDLLAVGVRVKKIIITTLGVGEAEVTSAASFTNDLGADSLDSVELIMEFEKEFTISIPDEDCESIVTVGQAISYLHERIK